VKQNELQNRLFNFFVDFIKKVRLFPNFGGYQVIFYLILKTETFVGVNYEEGHVAVSNADFSERNKGNQLLDLYYTILQINLHTGGIMLIYLKLCDNPDLSGEISE